GRWALRAEPPHWRGCGRDSRKRRRREAALDLPPAAAHAGRHVPAIVRRSVNRQHLRPPFAVDGAAPVAGAAEFGVRPPPREGLCQSRGARVRRRRRETAGVRVSPRRGPAVAVRGTSELPKVPDRPAGDLRRRSRLGRPVPDAAGEQLLPLRRVRTRMRQAIDFAMNRRAFLGRYAGGLGTLALAHLAAARDPLAPTAPRHAAKPPPV